MFLYVKGLGLGKFDDQILHQIKSCRTLIAVIGPAWIDRIAELRQPRDWVRKELEEGLKWQILMVPVVVYNARLPKESDLPNSLYNLLYYNFVRIHERHWKENVAEVIDSLAQQLGLQKRTRGQVPIPNLSGDWTDTDGVQLKMEHRDESIRFWLLDYYGQAVGQGEGTITDNQFSSQYFGPILAARGTATASSDGRQISGSVQYGAQRYGFSCYFNAGNGKSGNSHIAVMQSTDRIDIHNWTSGVRGKAGTSGIKSLCRGRHARQWVSL
ncbi:MAG: TIR domain-containing protein [Planctomycetes bacterium]|nr:TIR domain-containing protein [Planctomycetota bacterium]